MARPLRPTRSNRAALDVDELQEATDKLPTYLRRKWDFVVQQVRPEKLTKLMFLRQIIIV